MKSVSRSIRRGFTLIELSLALGLGIGIGAMTLAVFNQQLAFLKIYRTQNFLTEEAPIINTYVNRLVARADRFRLHDSVADALSGTNPRTAGAPVAVLNFRQPDGTLRATIMSFEDRGEGPKLYYYVVPTSGVLGAPEWAVTSRPADVRFGVVFGVLQMTVTGPAGEQITYSGTMQL